MNPEFWHKSWRKNQTGWHISQANPLLVKHFQEISLEPSSRIFIPLCGKTLDISWLLSQGYQVAGAELSEIAVEQLFAELSLDPTITELDKLKHYSSESIDIFVGNIFDLSQDVLGNVDAVYDRAALVALLPEIRDRYSVHLNKIVNNAPQLLITFEYDQSTMDGPPFSIGIEEVNRQYRNVYDIQHVASVEMSEKLKGQTVAKESVWLLS